MNSQKNPYSTFPFKMCVCKFSPLSPNDWYWWHANNIFGLVEHIMCVAKFKFLTELLQSFFKTRMHSWHPFSSSRCLISPNTFTTFDTHKTKAEAARIPQTNHKTDLTRWCKVQSACALLGYYYQPNWIKEERSLHQKLGWQFVCKYFLFANAASPVKVLRDKVLKL